MPFSIRRWLEYATHSASNPKSSHLEENPMWFKYCASRCCNSISLHNWFLKWTLRANVLFDTFLCQPKNAFLLSPLLHCHVLIQFHQHILQCRLNDTRYLCWKPLYSSWNWSLHIFVHFLPAGHNSRLLSLQGIQRNGIWLNRISIEFMDVPSRRWSQCRLCTSF